MNWGPRHVTADCWEFRLWAPALNSLDLLVEGCEPVAMDSVGDGWYAIKAPAEPGTRYRFILPDGLQVPDPASRAQSGGVHAWSVVTETAIAGRMPWKGRPWEETVIIEVHAGVLGGFAGVEAQLERLAALGITAIELMPIGAFPGARGWGYDGVLPFAPLEAYGTPADLRHLIDRAHALGVMVFLDVVYNHFGPDGNYLGLYAPQFFLDHVDTPWGGAVAVEQPAVADFYFENARMWIVDYGFDGLRLDAVHAIRNPAFLDDLARRIRAAVEPGRHVHLVLENEENDADRLRPGIYDAQWNDDFHNTVHVLLTGERESYYADFSDATTEKLARCLADGFVYQGEPSPNHVGVPRGTQSGHLPPTAFVNFLQNHDQTGNRAFGGRLTTLIVPERLRAAMALLLLTPQIPLLFMGEETGSDSPFLFFTDFSDELADVVREGRRQEFAGFAAFRDEATRERIPDPNARKTFLDSRPEPGPQAGAWQSLIAQLLALRFEHLVPRLTGTTSLGTRVLGEGAIEARWRLGDASHLTIAVNLGDQSITFRDIAEKPIFTQGSPGEPASIAVWRHPLDPS
ncbi:malto-oligosyltrehalose trehalohydrolase [Novosphingobium aquimarinum]|uniref:malto-oligosyltrehalose trehalohydrolase n=1 Tax=Novosphingobium aquimarinum TaxID=2682494 RepID=UPI001E5E90EA|nr:malto-oligosyltrehalose trehalohydrolase [Novosphingobium aquimarinum]